MKQNPGAKMLTSLIAGLIAVVGLSAAAGRADEDVSEIVAKTKRLYAGTSSATVNFTQSGDAGSASGILKYAKGNRFRLELTDRTIVSDGTATWTWIPKRNQVIITEASADGQLTPNDILTAFPGDYSTSLKGSGEVAGKAVWIVSASASGSRRVGDISKATLYIDKSTYRFRRIKVVSPSTGSMTLSINSANYNSSLPSSTFTFEAPDGARIVDLR